MTKAEACVWKFALKAGLRQGYKFRRQRPILNYIADFMCKELMLVIEVDGLTHEWEETIVKDEIKQRDLEAAGFTVLIFTDEEVSTQINSVVFRIDSYIENYKKVSHPLPPPPGDSKTP